MNNQNQIDVREILTLLGAKELEITYLRKQIGELQTALQQLTKDAARPAETGEVGLG